MTIDEVAELGCESWREVSEQFTGGGQEAPDASLPPGRGVVQAL
jgi:hypothetical protein